MVGQAREGTSDNTGVGRTKDDGAVMVQRKITQDTMRSRAPGARTHRNTERQVVDGLRTEVCGQQKQSNPHNNQHNPSTPTTGHR